MIKLNPVTPKAFTPNFQKNDKKQEAKYNDPLNKWPVRGLAYSNELGAALSEVAPTLGTLLWFPAMLYFGADIYDKYKNDKMTYNPDGKRGTEQAIFQLLASVLMPTGAVIAGQKLASIAGLATKDGLSLQSKEEAMKFLQQFASRRHIDDFKNDIDGFKEHFTDAITIKREKSRRELSKNPLKGVGKFFFGHNHDESIALSKKENLLNYTNKHIDDMFDIYKSLEAGKKPEQFSNKLFNKFRKLKIKYANDPIYKETYIRDAAEDIIKQYQKSKVMNAKILKTVGGFVALGLAIKPIDNFVEKVIIKKYVEPNLVTFGNKKKENKIA